MSKSQRDVDVDVASVNNYLYIQTRLSNRSLNVFGS